MKKWFQHPPIDMAHCTTWHSTKCIYPRDYHIQLYTPGYNNVVPNDHVTVVLQSCSTTTRPNFLFVTWLDVTVTWESSLSACHVWHVMICNWLTIRVKTLCRYVTLISGIAYFCCFSPCWCTWKNDDFTYKCFCSKTTNMFRYRQHASAALPRCTWLFQRQDTKKFIQLQGVILLISRPKKLSRAVSQVGGLL